MEALFSSLAGGEGLRARVLDTLRNALALAASHAVDIHIMTFSFTDPAIAGLLIEAAAAHPSATIRVLADWGQGSQTGGRQVSRLERCGLPNLQIRYKHDQPYEWNPARGRVRWSYRASRGLLHHKTLAVYVAGRPRILVCGSFNWTAKARNSYENLLLLTADDAASRRIMNCVEREFAAMWCDGTVTLSADEARRHYQAIVKEYTRDPDRAAGAVLGLGPGRGAELTAYDDDEPAAEFDAAVIAFSAGSPDGRGGTAGYASSNRRRRLDLHKPSGSVKNVPLTITTLALDVIGQSQSGETLKVAMYGLSSRVPEYGALLDAARRGVRVRALLDGAVGKPVMEQLARVQSREGLPLTWRAGRRMMHQKYIVHPEARTVLTGTANLSTDASTRHAEHRIVLRHEPQIVAAFLADFDTIWARLSSAC